MSIIGKKGSTLRKQETRESAISTTGYRSLVFWHEASEGDTSIPFGSLSFPSSVVGETNPSPTTILGAKLGLFKDNVKVFSSLNGELMVGLTCLVKNASITFLNGYEATEGEIFKITAKNDVVTGSNVVDARAISATGILAIGADTFVIGESFRYNANPITQQGEILVFRDGIYQVRCEDNLISGDGNYIEISNGDGFASSIQFKTIDGVNENGVVAVSNALLAEKPNISQLQYVDTLAGQLDAVIETVADLADVPTSNFQTAPNNVDLKAFGDQVIENKTDIALLEGLLYKVGDVVTSMLDEATFTSQRTGEWVLMDGRSVSGSSYATLTGNANVPDARGRFLRGKDNGAGVNPSELALGVNQEDELESHTHTIISSYQTAADGNPATAVNSGYSLNNIPNNKTTAATGGAETRPKNTTVNYFVRVN